MTKSVEAHISGHLSVLKGTILDPSSKSSEWLDPGNWVRDQFDLYVRAPLLNEVKDQLKQIQAKALALQTPSLEDLNTIWLEIDELRELLDRIPVVPNYFARKTESFGAGKRSALIRLWNAVSNVIARTVLPLETELCQSRTSASCVEGGQGTPMESDAILEARIQEPPISSNTDLSPGPEKSGLPQEEVVEEGEAVSRSPDSQSALAEWETIALEAGL